MNFDKLTRGPVPVPLYTKRKRDFQIFYSIRQSKPATSYPQSKNFVQS